jgi:competence ComEA-like helix-hairpin-helix protein
MKRDSWKDYFIFSRKERVAVIILLVVMAAFIGLPFLFSPKEDTVEVNEQLQQQLALLQQNNPPENYNQSNATITETPSTVSYQQSATKDSLFYFNPNTLDENGWKLLGVSDKTIHTILNYRNKGGKFYKPEDIEKIYGFNKDLAARLVPYVQIKNDEKNVVAKTFVKKDSSSSSPKIFAAKKLSVININAATADDFKNLPGIGDVLSNRIIKYRNAMGGFKSVDDVKKTYGLSDSVFQIIKPYLSL